MKLSGVNGVSAEYRIVGYQFDDQTVGSDDANWLIVETNVQTPDGTWGFTRADLTTHEATDLAQWLSGVANGAVPSMADPVSDFGDKTMDLRGLIDFIEPCFSFSLRYQSPDAVEVRLHFGHEGLPPWADTSGGGRYALYACYYVLVTTPAGLARAASDLVVESSRYPPR
jgi:hypothetical protein